MTHGRDEVQAAIDRYIAVRDQINAGNGTWRDLAQFFTDDAVFIDPAWGRVEGIEEMKASGFRAPPGMGMPPKQPNRDFSRPARAQR